MSYRGAWSRLKTYVFACKNDREEKKIPMFRFHLNSADEKDVDDSNSSVSRPITTEERMSSADLKDISE